MSSAGTWITLPYKYILYNKPLQYVKLNIKRSRALGEFHRQAEGLMSIGTSERKISTR